jgi:hypothetical protein
MYSCKRFSLGRKRLVFIINWNKKKYKVVFFSPSHNLRQAQPECNAQPLEALALQPDPHSLAQGREGGSHSRGPRPTPKRHCDLAMSREQAPQPRPRGHGAKAPTPTTEGSLWAWAPGSLRPRTLAPQSSRSWPRLAVLVPNPRIS